MFGSELPALVDQKRYEKMGVLDLNDEIKSLEKQLKDPNLTDMNRIALQEQLMIVTRVRDAKEREIHHKELQSTYVPVIVGGATYYFLKRNKFRTKYLEDGAPIIFGFLAATLLHRIMVYKPSRRFS